MIHLRRGTVSDVRERRPGLLDVAVLVDGDERHAVAYPGHTGPVRAGDVVVLNVSAVELGFGTGGVDFVIAVEGAAPRDPPAGGAMKLRYTGLQSVVTPVEEAHREAVDGASLEGVPVVLTGLHSALAPVCIAAKTLEPALRIAYVMTDGAGLAIAFSNAVPELRAAGLLDATLTAGQSFGGDYEAVNAYSGIAAARAVAGADLVLAGMGPGNLGTGSRLGFSLIEQGALVNAVAALGGTPVAVVRLSFSDPRARHRGVSHHTLTALGVAALARARLPLPDLPDEHRQEAEAALSTAGVSSMHDVETVPLGPAIEAALRDSPVPLRTMGRSYADDTAPFRAAAAAGIVGARLALRAGGIRT